MSRSIMSARKVLLKNRANQLEFQIMNLEEAQNTATNKMDNYQRAMQHEDNKASLWDMFNMHQYLNTGSGSYNSPEYTNNWEQYFWPYAQMHLIDSDIEAQKKQLESQLKATNAELEAVEKQEDQEIKNAAPKYG